jgi:hypothetical protein
MPTIPIRVLPGATELILDPASKSYHLNVGFNLSFSCKELIEAIATLDNDAVDIKVGTNVPVPGLGQRAPDPPQRSTPGLQGEFKPRELIQHPKIDANWDTKLHNLSRAALDYRQKITYATHDAVKFMKVYEEGSDPTKPAGQAPARPSTAPTATTGTQSNAPIAKQGAVAPPPGAAATAKAPGAPAGAASQPGKPPDMKDDCKTQ